MKRIIWLIAVLMLVLIAGCAPIEGIDGEEDNLPSIETEVDEETSEVVETTEEVVVPEETEVEEIEEVPVVVANFVRIKADALNVRKEPGIEHDRITKVYDGQIYEVLATAPDSEGLPWYQLTSADNITGWVSSEYCVPGEAYEDLVEEE